MMVQPLVTMAYHNAFTASPFLLGSKTTQSQAPQHKSRAVHFTKNRFFSRQSLLDKVLCGAEKGLDIATSRRANIAALVIQVVGGFGGSLLVNHINFNRNPVSLNVAPYCVNQITKAMTEPDQLNPLICAKGSTPGKNSGKTIPNQAFGTGFWDVPQPTYQILNQLKENCGASGGGPLTYIVALDLTKDKLKKKLQALRKTSK